MKQEVRAGFGRWLAARHHPTISLRFLDVGGGSDIIKYISSEFSQHPNSTGIDVLWGGGTDPFMELDRHHLLREITSVPETTLNEIPESILGSPLRAKDRSWFAVSLSAFGILYNKELLRRLQLPTPSSWEILADPKLYSWIACADPRKSASSHVIFEIILQAYGWHEGWKILQGMAANTRVFSSSSAQTPHDVAIGEVAYGFVIDSYGLQAVKRAGEETLGFVIPKNLTALSGDGVAILKGAPHARQAELFVEYLLSREGQTLLMAKKGSPGGPLTQELAKMSVIPALYETLKEQNSIPLNPFEWKTSFSYNFQLASKRWAVINDLIGIFLIEGNAYLRSVRESYAAGRHAPSAVVQEFVPAISEQHVQQLIDEKILLDPKLRNEELVRWRSLIPNIAHRRGINVMELPLWILSILVGWIMVSTVLKCAPVLLYFKKFRSTQTYVKGPLTRKGTEEDRSSR
jgi:ABC-type Fe3+ transport system substrate-binding protein